MPALRDCKRHNNANGAREDWTRIGPIWWTDYDGVLPYTDAEATEDGQGGLEFREVMAYLGTVGSQPLDANGQAMDTRFHHADLIGSVWLTTSSAGEPAGRVSYTAFGELLCGHGEDPEGCEPGWPGGSAPEGFPRYEYAGLWGYESAGFGEDPFGLGTDRSLLALGGVNPRLAPIRLLHVGWRWYQPDTGRFVQRDPIGLSGGLNVYAYVEDDPLSFVDPDGLAKGGRQNIRPSDLPSSWDKLSRSQKVRWLLNAIKKARSPGHKKALRAFLKVLKRGGMFLFVACIAVDAAELVHDAATWRPRLPGTRVPRAGQWRRYLDDPWYDPWY